jgi:hypothetical protein
MSATRVKVERTCMTSFMPGTHATGSRTVTKNEIMPNASAVTRGTMITMTLTLTNPHDVVLQTEDEMKEESNLFTMI